MSTIEFAFLVHVLFVLRRWMMIEEAHRRTIGNKRDNAVGFVVGEL